MTETAAASPATITDVARHAAVSVMTVSNVINDRVRVRPATRDRVLAAIVATGYRVNPVARALAGGRSRMITVFTDRPTFPYSSEVILGAAQAADAQNYDIVVVMLSAHTSSDLSVMGRLAAGALLIQPVGQGRLGPADLPPHVVSVNGPGPGQGTLSVDNYSGACQAMEYLLGLGHTRIGFISGLGGTPHGAEGQLAPDDAAQRLRGYRDSMAAAGLNIPAGYVQRGDYTRLSGERATRKLLALRRRPTALFVSGDAMALAAMHVAQDLGLAVPHDLSVIGFDDLPIAASSRPALTTVRQPLQQLGEAAVNLLTALSEGRPAAWPPAFPTRLVLRESVAAPGDLAPVLIGASVRH